MKLQGKTALITGAARRIGREIALTLAGRGVSIMIHYRQSMKDAGALKREIEAIGARAYLIDADFSVSKKMFQSVRGFVQKAFRIAPIDILVNNAAIFYPVPFGRVGDREWDDFLTVNLKAPFFLAQEIGTRMVKRLKSAGGECAKIINLVDWTVFRPPMRFLPYAIAKAGLAAATEGLAKALAPHVQVNSIAPGPILPAKGMTKREKRTVAGRTLLKRFGHPNDIAQTVRFLCEDTDYITGAFIPVDGGSLLA